MARIRRKLKITGDEYNFGGGASSGSSTSAGGFVKIAKGHPNRNNASHDGFFDNGSTITIAMDAGGGISEKDQYIYFDNAFETGTGTVTYEFLNGDTALPAGVSWATNTDGSNTDTGEARFYGTPSAVGTNSFKVKVDYPYGSAAEQVSMTYTLKVLPTGTTPIWTGTLAPLIAQNVTDPQIIVAGPTTNYSGATYTLSNVSGFLSGVNPVIDSETGAVSVSNVGAAVQAASAHALTVTVDLGEYGTVPKTFSGNVSYGDPYGARYFGPANYKQNQQSSLALSLGEEDTYHNPSKSSGALRREWNAPEDTSPYYLNDTYGCIANGSYVPSQSFYDQGGDYYKHGVMGINPTSTQIMCSASNHAYVSGFWVVPGGVTSICAVAVGAGSMGCFQWSADGGGGGGLAWMNGITVVPGEVLQWCWGLGKSVEASNGSYGGGASWLRRHSGGANQEHILFAQGGGWTGYSDGSPNGKNTSYTGGVTVSGLTHWDKGNGYAANNQRDGGGWGVRTEEGSPVDDGTGTTFHYGGGAPMYSGDRHGMGAGGYRGNGTQTGQSTAGYYGGGGAGYDYSSTHGYGAGGGVGLDGQGEKGGRANADPRANPNAGSGYGGSGGNWTSYGFGSPNYRGGGGGGSGGTRGAYGENQFTGGAENGNGNGHRVGGLHGGGGGGSGTSSGGGHGASGGLRIIWGTGEDGTARSFPYTYCSEKPSMKYNGEH